MKKYQDIKLTDVELKKQFIQAYISGDYSFAFSILENNPQLNTKSFTEDVINIIYNILITIENYYIDGVPNFLSLKFSEYEFVIDNFINKGNWDNSVTYIKYHFVVYNDNIYMYINDNETSGIVPENNPNYWVLLGLKGATGNNGIGTNLKYRWSSTTNYITKDVVIYGNFLYVALRNNLNRFPLTSTSDWQILFEMPRARIVVSTTEPVYKYKGMIWWKTF